MLSSFFSSLAESFRARLFDDPSASATASHFDALADAERTQEAFQQANMFDHSTAFDNSSAFDHSSFDSGSSFGSGSSFD